MNNQEVKRLNLDTSISLVISYSEYLFSISY